MVLLNVTLPQFGESMSLPIITTDNDQRWSCHQCGHCCRGSLVYLSEPEVKRILDQRWGEDADLSNKRLMVATRIRSRPFRLAHRADGTCVFLGADGLCRIHAKFGHAAKPTICQVFPLQLVPQDKHAILTTRRACPSAAADKGAPVSDQLPFIKELVHEGQLRAEAIAAPLFKTNERRDWKTARVVLKCAADLLQDERYPPVRRLVHALQFAGLLNKAKTRQLDDSKVWELCRTLASLVPEESKIFFEQRTEPKSYSKVMFRLMAIECARLHPDVKPVPRWSSRLQLMRIAFKVVVGSGKTPFVDTTFPITSFDRLEQPLGALSPELYRPLFRMIETNAASAMYAIAERSDWSVIESIRALAILYPVGLWLLRWVAHERPPTIDDMLSLVVALDRTQGHAALSGGAHRWRLSMLGSQEELERLIVWYGR